MREVFQRESRILVASLALGLGATACGGKEAAPEAAYPKAKAQNAVFLEHKSATIEYFGNNRRRATITPANLVFEEFCQGLDMHILRLDHETLNPISEAVVEGARQCRDSKITPEDFGERLTPANQDLDFPH